MALASNRSIPATPNQCWDLLICWGPHFQPPTPTKRDGTVFVRRCHIRPKSFPCVVVYWMNYSWWSNIAVETNGSFTYDLSDSMGSPGVISPSNNIEGLEWLSNEGKNIETKHDGTLLRCPWVSVVERLQGQQKLYVYICTWTSRPIEFITNQSTAGT